MSSPASPTGLTTAEAARRLARHGPNALAAREHRGLVRNVIAVATEPMFGLLLVASAIYLVLGDLGEGLLLAFFALMTVGLVVWQERRSERVLDALRELAAPRVRVRRDGQVRQVPATELVPGDWLLVGEGERVAADAVLRACRRAVGRRVPAHGGVGAGAQAGTGTGCCLRGACARRRRPALDLRQHPGRGGPRRRRGAGHRRA